MCALLIILLQLDLGALTLLSRSSWQMISQLSDIKAFFIFIIIYFFNLKLNAASGFKSHHFYTSSENKCIVKKDQKVLPFCCFHRQNTFRFKYNYNSASFCFPFFFLTGCCGMKNDQQQVIIMSVSVLLSTAVRPCSLLPAVVCFWQITTEI